MLNVKHLKLLPKTEIIEREKNFNRHSRDKYINFVSFIHFNFFLFYIFEKLSFALEEK